MGRRESEEKRDVQTGLAEVMEPRNGRREEGARVNKEGWDPSFS